MKLEELAGKCGEWLRGSGPESDIVISSRIRLARNLAEFPFVRRASSEERGQLSKLVKSRLAACNAWPGLMYLDLHELDEVDRQFLVERQLMSREMAEGDGERGVAVDQDERFSIMVNEEDHLRIQVICSGLDVQTAWERIDKIDDLLEQRLTYAYHDTLGYLTACPTNVGTGLRVSVMLHLPALVVTREIEKVFRSLQKINVAVRGLYGEGSQFMGDFYQISNQITLGRSELELVETVNEVVPRIIEYERAHAISWSMKASKICMMTLAAPSASYARQRKLAAKKHCTICPRYGWESISASYAPSKSRPSTNCSCTHNPPICKSCADNTSRYPTATSNEPPTCKPT